MRIGNERSGSAKSVTTVCTPTQRTGAARPSAVSTRSPMARLSTGVSPAGVVTIVPARKQTVKVLVSKVSEDRFAGKTLASAAGPMRTVIAPAFTAM